MYVAFDLSVFKASVFHKQGFKYFKLDVYVCLTSAAPAPCDLFFFFFLTHLNIHMDSEAECEFYMHKNVGKMYVKLINSPQN